jgi:hypothetical protein
MSELDILQIHAKVHANFQEETMKLPEYCKSLEEICLLLESDNLTYNVRSFYEDARDELLLEVDDLRNEIRLNLYEAEVARIIDEYRTMLTTEEHVVWVGKKRRGNIAKQSLINRFMDIASQYVDIDMEPPKKPKRISCPHCGNKKEFEIIETSTYICQVCFSQQIVAQHAPSPKDIDRVNVTSKYMYDRKVHFRDCVNQYQGRQNCTIPPSLYDELELEFKNHHLLKGDKNMPRTERFSGITKQIILRFLRELGYSKHYENVHLIHYKVTDIKPDDISYLEDKLYEDFNELVVVYDHLFGKTLNRKNFINTQQVLLQLLIRHKHHCNLDDFSILKTLERKAQHDEILEACFRESNWSWKSKSF